MSTAIKKTYSNNRKVYSLPDDFTLRSSKTRSSTASRKNEDTTKLIKYIDDNIIGKNSTFQGPFGRRKVVYCDYIASGRSLQFIEDYITKEVLPSYGNTHATTSITSLQSTLFRQEARDIIRNAVNANEEEDAVVFTGHGCAAAVSKLICTLGLDRGDVEPPLVFTGPCDHHTNLIPWRDIGAQVVKIRETKDGNLDLNDLENQLQMHFHDGKMLIGCFSAVSNITGIETDTVATTLMLHQYGALAFWDYANAAPYVHIDMNPEFSELNQKIVYKDAVFFSGHKFIGGVQTPGILIAKKMLFKRNIPEYYMDPTDILCSKNIDHFDGDIELREEGYAAPVVETIRAGLAMQLKETIGVQSIISRAEKVAKNVLAHMRTIPEVILLGTGCNSQKRLPVFSFMVRHPRGTFLHHNFVCAVLNDVFGIQARGGCACAGPYAQDLLSIDDELVAEYENVLVEDKCPEVAHTRHSTKHSHFEILRPGFSRISLPFCMSEAEVTYVMEAIKMVATEAWKLLPQYVLSRETGEWRHHTNMMCKDRKWLGSIRYTDGKMVNNERRISGPGTFPQTYSDCLQTARNIFNRARKMAQKHPVSEQSLILDNQMEKLRWFMLPSEAQDLLLGNSQKVKHDVPFQPNSQLPSRHSFEQPAMKRVHNVTPFGSPRHFSLSAVDDRCPYMFHRHYDTYIDYHIPSNHPPHFALGEVVTPLLIQKFDRLIEESPSFSRNRCFSLGSETSPPQEMKLNVDGRTVHCASHNDLTSYGLEVTESPQHSITQTSSGSGSDCSIIGRSTSPVIPLSRHNTDNLQAYLKEVTKELATEIKSEIREVISKVEDVLENTDSVDVSSLPFLTERHNSSSDESRGDSVSANDVAEYLMGMSKEMASEVKSEIREMVSAVDLQLEKPCRPNRLSPVNSKRALVNMNTVSKNSQTDKTEDLTLALNKSHSSSKLSDEEHSSLDLDNKTHPHLWSTINSVSSQDSGINLSFHEQDSVVDPKPRSSSESSSSRRNRKNNGVFPNCRPVYLQKPTNSDIMESKTSSPDSVINVEDRLKNASNESTNAWHVPPKNIWKPAIEAIKEFEMISDGDKILVFLSDGVSSFGLLHTLLQYRYYMNDKGINFSISAAAIGLSDSLSENIASYLKSINIEYLHRIENQIIDMSKQISQKNDSDMFEFCNPVQLEILYDIAKEAGYNVIAFGQHLGDLANSFFTSMLRNGKFQTFKAQYILKEQNLRIICPLIYVHEDSLKHFAESKNLPNIEITVVRNDMSKFNEVIAQQQKNIPGLYESLKAALRPLVSSTPDCESGLLSSSSIFEDNETSVEQLVQ